MKIVYVIDCHPEVGGAPISTCEVASGIAEKEKAQVQLVLPGQKKEYSIKNRIDCVEIPEFPEIFPLMIAKPIKSLQLVPVLCREIRRLKPDIVHVHMICAAFAIGLGKRLGLVPSSCKYVYTDRAGVKTFRWPFRILAFFLIRKNFDAVICLTSNNENYWKTRNKKLQVKTIANFAGERYEIYDAQKHTEQRKKLGISMDSFVMMFAGRFSIEKNWKLVAQIVEELQKEEIVFLFAIMTEGKKQEKKYREFVQFLNTHHIKYQLCHNVNQEVMSNLYYAADLFALTSDVEPFGRTAIEAMSRKVAVLGRDVGGIGMVIEKKENLLEPSAQTYAQRVREYIANRELLQTDQEWFFKRFCKKYTKTTSIQLHQKFYEDLLQR